MLQNGTVGSAAYLASSAITSQLYVLPGTHTLQSAPLSDFKPQSVLSFFALIYFILATGPSPKPDSSPGSYGANSASTPSCSSSGSPPPHPRPITAATCAMRAPPTACFHMIPMCASALIIQASSSAHIRQSRRGFACKVTKELFEWCQW